MLCSVYHGRSDAGDVPGYWDDKRLQRPIEAWQAMRSSTGAKDVR